MTLARQPGSIQRKRGATFWLKHINRTRTVGAGLDRRPIFRIMKSLVAIESLVMDEEYLFWDNQTYMKQIGVGQ